MTEAVEALARSIAEQAHAWQVDKAGAPYIGHCARVVARLTDPLDRAVGWLHDVIEDTGRDWVDLAVAVDPEGDVSNSEWKVVIDTVELLTHRKHEPRADYYARVRTSERAVRVKLADIADNADPERLALLDDATRERLTVKYQRAREALGEE